MLVPIVSVVIPCHNYGVYLREAVNSILAQTFIHFQIIVVDDGSTDPVSLDITQKFKAEKTTVIHTANQGVAAARNEGIARSDGKYILCLDADDKLEPTFLEKAVAVLEQESSVGLVTCKACFFGARQGVWNLPDVSSIQNLLFRHCVPSTCVLFRKADWEAVGGFDTSPVLRNVGEDFDFWLGLLELGRSLHQLPEVLFWYRRHSDSIIGKLKKFNKIAKYETFLRSTEYQMKKHINLYLRYSELFLPKLFLDILDPPPRFALMKRKKYKIMMACYVTFCRLPWFNTPRFAERRRNLQSRIDAIDFYAQRGLL